MLKAAVAPPTTDTKLRQCSYFEVEYQCLLRHMYCDGMHAVQSLADNAGHTLAMLNTTTDATMRRHLILCVEIPRQLGPASRLCEPRSILVVLFRDLHYSEQCDRSADD